jgi:hypothetical protein
MWLQTKKEMNNRTAKQSAQDGFAICYGEFPLQCLGENEIGISMI